MSPASVLRLSPAVVVIEVAVPLPTCIEKPPAETPVLSATDAEFQADPSLACVNCGEVLLIVMLLALPELLLTIERRAPLASVTTLAVTPRPCPLMALAKLSQRLAIRHRDRGSPCRCPLATKNCPPKVPCCCWPQKSWNTTKQWLASWLTFTVMVPGAAVPVAVAVAMLESEEPTSIDDNAPRIAIQRR